MQLVERYAVRANRRQAERGEQARPVGEEQLVECPSDAVVAQRLWYWAIKAEQLGLEAARPLAEAVEWLAPECQVAHQHPEALAGGIPQRESGSGR